MRASRVSPVGSARARASRPVAMSESPAGAPDPGSDPAGDAPPSELKRAISDPAPASASSREPSGKLMRSASMRRTPLARFASAGRKAGSMRLTMSQTLTKTRAKTDYRRDILSKPSEERTESDLLSLMEILGRLRFAESLRHAEKVEVCKSMGYRSKRKGAVVFNQGDPGSTFYIVLSGSVSVSIRAGESESEEHVASLYNGDSFGELALLREGSVRSATVRAETDVEFLVISREDYNTILGAVTEDQLAEKIDFLIALPAFAGVPLSMIRSVAYVLTTRGKDVKPAENFTTAVAAKLGKLVPTHQNVCVFSKGVMLTPQLARRFGIRRRRPRTRVCEPHQHPHACPSAAPSSSLRTSSRYGEAQQDSQTNGIRGAMVPRKCPFPSCPCRSASTCFLEGIS